MNGKDESVELSLEKPVGFAPTLQIVACYLEVDRHLLLLQRSPHKPYGTFWGVPAGKVEKGEAFANALLREVFEETAICLEKDELAAVGNLYVRNIYDSYVYHMFHVERTLRPEVVLNSEHVDYCWVPFAEVLSYPLISGGSEAFSIYRTTFGEDDYC